MRLNDFILELLLLIPEITLKSLKGNICIYCMIEILAMYRRDIIRLRKVSLTAVVARFHPANWDLYSPQIPPLWIQESDSTMKRTHVRNAARHHSVSHLEIFPVIPVCEIIFREGCSLP